MAAGQIEDEEAGAVLALRTAREPYPLAPEPTTIVPEAIRIHLDEHKYTQPELAEALLLTPDEFDRDLVAAPRRYSNVVSLFSANG